MGLWLPGWLGTNGETLVSGKCGSSQHRNGYNPANRTSEDLSMCVVFHWCC